MHANLSRGKSRYSRDRSSTVAKDAKKAGNFEQEVTEGTEVRRGRFDRD